MFTQLGPTLLQQPTAHTQLQSSQDDKQNNNVSKRKSSQHAAERQQCVHSVHSFHMLVPLP